MSPYIMRYNSPVHDATQYPRTWCEAISSYMMRHNVPIRDTTHYPQTILIRCITISSSIRHNTIANQHSTVWCTLFFHLQHSICGAKQCSRMCDTMSVYLKATRFLRKRLCRCWLPKALLFSLLWRRRVGFRHLVIRGAWSVLCSLCCHSICTCCWSDVLVSSTCRIDAV